MKNPWPEPGRYLATSLLVLLMNACAPRIQTQTLLLVVSPAAHQNSAVAVDIVSVHNSALIAPLAGLSAQEWFFQRDLMLLQYPSALAVYHLELLSGASVEQPVENQGVRALFVFAGLPLPGIYSVRVGHIERVRMRLGSRGMEVEAR